MANKVEDTSGRGDRIFNCVHPFKRLKTTRIYLPSEQMIATGPAIMLRTVSSIPATTFRIPTGSGARDTIATFFHPGLSSQRADMGHVPARRDVCNAWCGISKLAQWLNAGVVTSA